MGYKIHPLTRAEAKQILSWRYAKPYDYYNPPEIDDPDGLVAQFVDPINEFHAVRDQSNRFVGFCSFGLDGQVPGGNYAAGPLDLGLGMKPENTSQGFGRGFFKAIIAFAISSYQPPSLRLSVARFNQRAIRVYESCGFKTTAEFLEIPTRVPHIVMEYSQGS